MADRASVPFNIYTVLAVVAMIALLIGVVYLAMRSDELFGSWNPMDAKDLPVLLPAHVQSLLA